MRAKSMSDDLPTIYLARHGETAWSVSGQHTGRTDIPLTERGQREALRLGERLRAMTFAWVLSSPLQRASRTCELAGLGGRAELDPDLVEWDYGQYEGLRSSDIRAQRPEWDIYRDGCPSGETPQQISARADRVVDRLRALPGDGILFSHGHFIRALTARWLGLELQAISPYLALDTASLGALGYEHQLSRPNIRLWNVSCEGKG